MIRNPYLKVKSLVSSISRLYLFKMIEKKMIIRIKQKRKMSFKKSFGKDLSFKINIKFSEINQ